MLQQTNSRTVQTVCSSPLAFEVLSAETFGRSLPQCGTGPETPGMAKKRDFVMIGINIFIDLF